MKKEKLSTAIIGNIGLFYVCYELSRRGFVVTLSSRKTLVVKSQFAEKTVQVRTTSTTTGSPIGVLKTPWDMDEVLENFREFDFWVIVKLSGKPLYKPENVAICSSRDNCPLAELSSRDGSRWWLDAFHPQSSHEKEWDKRKGKAGWKLIEDALNADSSGEAAK